MTAAVTSMNRGLRTALIIVDGAMLVYWSVAALAAGRVIALPAAAMYAGYGTPLIDAWNWSFAPLDLVFAITGLAAVRLARAGNARWRAMAIVSLTLNGAAGLMAVAFWALTGAFDPAWWIPNLVLIALPLVFVPGLAQSLPAYREGR